MALTDQNHPVIPSLPDVRLPDANGQIQERLRGLAPSASRQALSRLPQIHAEISETALLGRFVGSAVRTAAALMVLGALALVFAGGASLQQEFAWSLLVLAGVGATLRCYIKSIAQAFDRAPLREAAKDLRAVIFYAGFAWGAGAFLLLGNNPVPLSGLCFAILPTLAVVILLKDRSAGLGFVLPVTVLTTVAIVMEPWSDAIGALALLLIVQGSIAVALALPLRALKGQTMAHLPAGLSLR